MDQPIKTINEAELDALLASMTPAQAQQAIREIEQLKKKHEESMYDNYKPMDHQTPIHADKRKIVTVMGGNRCLGGEQVIYDPVAKINRRVDQIKEPFHVWAWDFQNRKKVIAKAFVPFKKIPNELYRINFRDSGEIMVSPSHLFWSHDTWFEAREILDLDTKFMGNPDGTEDEVLGFEFVRTDIVWDFEVEHYHNYIIGNVISHNSGKSHCCGYTIACHAMGKYPDWWEGLRFNGALDIGVVSITTEQLRKSAQVKLMGEPYALGTGFIPRELIHDYAWRKGSNGCLDWVLIKHASGGLTRINFMTSEQGQKVFMGFAWNLCWYDEEPDISVYNEVAMRLVDKKGYAILSFYPYNGVTELINKLDKMPPEFCGHYQLAMQDNKTLDPEEIRLHEMTMPEWEKESRMYGRPGAGEGRIFQFSRDDYVIDPFEIEPNWRQLGGLDVGFGHATGALTAAIDDNADCVYIFREYISTKALPNVHASALRRWGDVDFKIDTSAHRRSATDGKNLFDMYIEEGLNISNADTRGGSVQASINKINLMLSENRLFIFSTCRELIRQMGLYRMVKNSKTGQVKVIEKDDDLIDPLRYIVNSLDEARVPGTHKLKLMPRVVEWQPFNRRIGI